MNNTESIPFQHLPVNNMSFSKRRLAFGVGVNDAPYLTQPIINGKKVICPFYLKWSSMMRRCYSETYQSNQPTYIGCSVAQEWHTFMDFREWMERQEWEGNELDKDILRPGNKVYGSDTCVFVDRATNALLNNNATKRGEWPIGVFYHKPSRKFMALCRSAGKKVFLGRYDTAEAAHNAWRIAKAKVITDCADRQTDKRVRNALLLRASSMKKAVEGVQ